VIRKATREDIRPVTGALARAFFDDPVMTWLFERDGRRLRQTRRFFGLRMRQLLEQEEVYTTADLTGGALWAAPGRWRLTPLETLAIAVPLLPALGRRLPRSLRGLELVEHAHPAEPEHYYLAVLGTDPDHQGEGIGSALMGPVLESCDRDGIGAYLESSKERNIDFYSRHGFRVRGEIVMPKGPPIWPMWREPLGPGV
jgi:ribosomal protein S18 acetylase RimI-like enzyme